MQSIAWTTRVVTRALRSGLSTLVEPSQRVKPHLVSVACGFPKDILGTKYRLGRFGEDAYFISSTNSADVIGKWFIWLIVRFRLFSLEAFFVEFIDKSECEAYFRNQWREVIEIINKIVELIYCLIERLSFILVSVGKCSEYHTEVSCELRRNTIREQLRT